MAKRRQGQPEAESPTTEEDAGPEREEGAGRRVEVEQDIETPFERMTLEKEEREIEKHEAEIELGDKTKDAVESFLKQEHEDKHNKFALQWFEDNKRKLERKGESTDVSDERKIEIAAKSGAFRELRKEKKHRKTWEEIENVSAIMVDFKDGKVSPDGMGLTLNRLEKRVDGVKEDLKWLEGDEKIIKQQELDKLFRARQEIAEKISGRDLKGEAENKKEIKDWQDENKYSADKGDYKEENYKRIGEERRQELIGRDKEEIGRREGLTEVEKEKEIRKIEAKDYTRELAKKLLGYDIQKKGRIRKRFEIIDESGESLRPIPFKKENEAIQFLEEKVEEKMKEDVGEEWETRNKEREEKVRELVEKEIKGLAKSPEAATGKVKAVYSRLKDKLVLEFAQKMLREEERTEQRFGRIEEMFEEKGINSIKFLDNILHRKEGLEDLTGEWDDDGEKIEDFLNSQEIQVEPDRMQKFLDTERGKEYKEMAEKQKGLLDWLIDLVFFFLEEDKNKTKERKGKKKGNK